MEKREREEERIVERAEIELPIYSLFNRHNTISDKSI
jgi:hypothetical protein